MKITIAIILCMNILHAGEIAAQTYIEPVIGYRFTRNMGFSELEYPANDVLSDEDYGNSSLVYGMGLTHQLTERLTLGLSGEYTRQSVTYIDIGFVGYTDVEFRMTSYGLMAYYEILSSLEIGAGIDYKHLSDFILVLDNNQHYRSKFGESYRQKQLGWIISGRFAFKSFILSLDYAMSKSIQAKDYHFIARSDAFQLALSYRFKLPNLFGEGRNKSGCPAVLE